ncbi:unnamed protein product [Timema podura]|uniref:t-SNARE coiled-coil homology domain-containing protein n=1 Tax=Timema podura TaxID=61482 RepID=A0ABN7NTN4_TIMPD|nr:unnamed protein product [Timema podura]
MSKASNSRYETNLQALAHRRPIVLCCGIASPSGPPAPPCTINCVLRLTEWSLFCKASQGMMGKGQYYEPVPTQFSNGDALEEENEKMTDELKDKIHVLKSLSIDIGAEVKFQDKMLREMEEHVHSVEIVR